MKCVPSSGDHATKLRTHTRTHVGGIAELVQTDRKAQTAVFEAFHDDDVVLGQRWDGYLFIVV